jgi:hypothetical protein
MTISSVGQGTARIVATSAKLLCTAQVLDSENDPPTSITTLPIFAKLKQKGD